MMKFLKASILGLSVLLSPYIIDMAKAHNNDPMQMMESSPHAERMPYNLQFIDTMIQHHKAAIIMAQMALKKAQNSKIKDMARNIVNDQKKEIARMKEIRDKSYAHKQEAINMNLPGMKDSMKDMDLVKLKQSSGRDFDRQFVAMMIPHHQGAITMSLDALKNATNQDIKNIAQGIIKKQRKEIAELEQIQDELKTGANK